MGGIVLLSLRGNDFIPQTPAKIGEVLPGLIVKKNGSSGNGGCREKGQCEEPELGQLSGRKNY